MVQLTDPPAPAPPPDVAPVLRDFHPAVQAWFQRHFAAPTDAQTDGWPHIRARRDVLIAAPTGSGKTLAAFLAGIDALIRKAEAGLLDDHLEILYVSPLKALGADIHRNLEAPLAEINAIAAELGYELPPIRVARAQRRHDAVPAPGHHQEPAPHPHHHPRVALPDAHRGQGAPHPATRPHAHRR